MGWIILGFTAYLVIYAVFLLVAFYDIWQYGFAGDASKIMIIVYIILSLSVVVGTFFFILGA
jgi:hypothetical protein